MASSFHRLLTPVFTFIAIVADASPVSGQARISPMLKEPLLETSRPGIAVTSSISAPDEHREAIARKLGGKIERLTNSNVRIQGKPIQVNVIMASDDTSAESIWTALNRIKKPPYLHRNGLRIVEYVLSAEDEALARKTSWELGLEPRPSEVRYRVTAKLATIDRSDDMAANPLFEACLSRNLRNTPEIQAKIAELAAKFDFGDHLTLRATENGQIGRANFEPKPKASRPHGSSTVYEFADQPKQDGIPYVTAIIETTVKSSGAAKVSTGNAASPIPRHMTAATPRWPADDPKFRELAASITAGKTDPEAKVAALLSWLAPGRNIRYQGQTGSRWGSTKALDQKFGHCWDFSDLFVTLARASGVPTRQVAGWLYGSSGHVWAEWYSPQRGWVPVDPTGAGILPCGIYHIPYFTTDDGEMPIVYLAMPAIEILETR
jgi:hypothetical protein